MYTDFEKLNIPALRQDSLISNTDMLILPPIHWFPLVPNLDHHNLKFLVRMIDIIVWV